MNPTIQFPLLLHLLVETPASLSFLLAPRSQLRGASPEAVLILRNLGGLLLATNLVCLVLLSAGSDGDGGSRYSRLAASVCLCLATYHVWPAHRAYSRIARGVVGGKDGGRKVLGGPKVHLAVHLVCLAALLAGGWTGIMY